MLGGCLEFPEPDYFDVGLRQGAKIVEMAQHQARFKYRVGLAKLTNFITLPTTGSERMVLEPLITECYGGQEVDQTFTSSGMLDNHYALSLNTFASVASC
jgi:hypothetical protein